MVQICCVKGCKSTSGSLNENGGKVTFHRIPRVILNQCQKTKTLSEVRNRQWITRLRLSVGLARREHLRVCSNHFFSGRPAKLFDECNPDWAPCKCLNIKYSRGDEEKLLRKANRYNRRISRLKSIKSNQSSHLISEESIVKSHRECTSTVPSVNNDSLVMTIDEIETLVTEEPEILLDSGKSVESSINDTSVTLNTTSFEDSGVLSDESLDISLDVKKQTGIKEDYNRQIQGKRPQMKSVYVQTEYLFSVNFATQTEQRSEDANTQTFARVCDSVHLESAMIEKEGAKTLINELREKLVEKENLILSYQNEMQEKVTNLNAIYDELKMKSFSEYCFAGNNEKVKFYTGLESYEYLIEIFDEVKSYLFQNSKLSTFQQLILTLMKLRLGLKNRDLAYRFYVSERTAGRVFYNTLDALSKRLARYIYWPERHILRATMPMCFREHFDSNVAVIIDCFEIFTEKPSSVVGQAETWSNYKHHNTVKYLIGITPQGTVAFLSKGWGGRVSDKHLTENCNFLEKLLPGDIVLADRGFNIQDSVGLYYATVKLPAFTKNKAQLDPKAIEDTRKIANVRIHVERVIGHLRQKFSILHNKIPVELLHGAPEEDLASIDKITVVACALVNLCPSVVPLE